MRMGSMPTRREQYGWLMLALVAFAALALGVRLLVTGAPGNPALVERLTGQDWQDLLQAEPGISRLVGVMARHEGLAVLGWGIWLAWSSLRGYRSGDRWIWYAWWTVPALMVGIRVTGASAGGVLPRVLLGLALLTVGGLLLSRPALGGTPEGGTHAGK
jgi:hypothetical protein